MGQHLSEPSSNSNSPEHSRQQNTNNGENSRNGSNDEQQQASSSSSSPENVVESIGNEIRKQSNKILGQAVEITKLTYAEFEESLVELNAL